MADFEWDEKKNAANKQKHGIPFEKAKETFADPNAVTYTSSTNTELDSFV